MGGWGVRDTGKAGIRLHHQETNQARESKDGGGGAEGSRAPQLLHFFVLCQLHFFSQSRSCLTIPLSLGSHGHRCSSLLPCSFLVTACPPRQLRVPLPSQPRLLPVALASPVLAWLLLPCLRLKTPMPVSRSRQSPGGIPQGYTAQREPAPARGDEALSSLKVGWREGSM